MSIRSLARSLVLAAGLLPAPLCAQGQWDPLFDYTNLQPANDEYWAPLVATSVAMEEAVVLAAQAAEGGAASHVLRAELRPGPEGAVWFLETIEGEGADAKRVNLTVSGAEKKVLKRLELRSMTSEEKTLLEALPVIQVPADHAVGVAKKTALGDKPEPLVQDPRARTVKLILDKGVPLWNFELMALDRKQHKPRRYDIMVDTRAPRFKHMILLDRFPGTPLRRGEPTLHESGLVIFDWREGEGEEATPASRVKVDYRLWLLDNTKIHDTHKTELPETFVVSQAPLEGMRKGIVGMKPGGRRKICIPYDQAFGEKGNELAPPRAMVVCDLYLAEYVE